MNKKLLELLNQINEKKKEVIDLANAGKIEEAKKAKEELKTMQDKFDLLKDMEEPEKFNPENSEPEAGASGGVKSVSVNYNHAVHDFAEAARYLFKNASSSNEGTKADGGYTVPEDIKTEINRYREAEFSLQSLVDTENVTTDSGRRTYQSRKSHTGFNLVTEGAKIKGVEPPKFEVIEYSIKKYSGWLPVTNELLADSDANITNTLIEWLGKEDTATRNRLILEIMQGVTVTALKNLDDIKKVINVTLGSAFSATSKIVTNEDGLNWMDNLKDTTGRYLLKPNMDQTSPIKYQLAVGATNIPIVVVPKEILKSDTTTAKKRGIPMLCGDTKEAVKIFDRQKLSILGSNTASVTDFNAYEQDMTLFRGILRMDVVKKDAKAFVNGVLTIDDDTVTGS